MGILQHIFTIVIRLLIAIGDGVVFLLSWLLAGLYALRDSIRALLHRPHQRRKKSVGPSPLWTKLKYFLVGVIFSFIFLFLPLVSFALIQSIPNPTNLNQQQFPQTTKIYDRHHRLLYQIYANQNRTLVKLSDIPLDLQEATIAIEDKNFYANPGFDITAIIRAAVSDVTHHNFQGGSTITQQLIKSALLTSDISLNRKLQEVVLAFWAEHLYSKKQILEMYLNQVPYGGTSWGVESAAQTYFGKNVKDLSLAESAFLAGLPQAPSQYSPFGPHPTLWKNRQKDVLAHMHQLGYISLDQEQQAMSETLHFVTPDVPLLAPHFVMYVKDVLIQKYGLPLVEKGGLSVVTSLDLPTQEMAQKIVATEVGNDAYLQLTNGAAVVANPQNGDILAMVGSADYNNPDFGNVNIATSFRQPGSSIKVVTYSAALSKGYTSATTIDDAPISFSNAWETYSPVNYDGQFHGRVTLRQALANSFNIPAVKILNSIGIDSFVDTGRRMGIESLQDASTYGLSVTLGAADVTMLDMTTAYSTLANMGNRVDLNPILEVTDNQGHVVEQKKSPVARMALDPGVAYIMGDILADNAARSWEFGPNSPLHIDGHRVSVKTGTTDNKRDNWTIGYTPHYVVTVWVGNNDNTPMSPTLASGITGAAPIWHDIMANLLANTKDLPVHIPDDIVSKECSGKTEYFIKGTENSVNCNVPIPTWTPTPTPH